MPRWKVWTAVLVVVLLAGGALGYANRTALLLAAVKFRSSLTTVVAYQPIEWQQGPSVATQSPAERPPNIVFILFDDLGINDLVTFGQGVANGRVPTPNIDRLAAQGALFTQAYAGNATCAPSRAQLMTGRDATRTGFEYTPTPPGMPRVVSMVAKQIRPDSPPIVYHADIAAKSLPYAEQGLPSEEVTIAEVLKTRGYHTVHIGKWHLGATPEFHPNNQGFDESLNLEGLLHLPEDHPDAVNARIDFDPIDRFLWASGRFANSYNGGELFGPPAYLADYWTDEATRVISANRHRPFFLYLAHWGTHTPLQATRADYEAVGDIVPHRLRVYAAMVRALDRSVGRIMTALAAEGLAENTLVVISSDNGGAGYIGIEDLNAPFRGGKATFFEGGIRVPMLAHWPGKIPAGTRVSLPVTHTDLMPTFAAAGGAALPPDITIDGRNWLPAITGEGPMVDATAPLFWQSGYYKAVRAGDWKLQVNEKQGRTWLYHLADDPTEQRNLADIEPGRRAALQALLDGHHQGRTPPLYPSTIDLPVMVDKTLAERFAEGDEYIYWAN